MRCLGIDLLRILAVTLVLGRHLRLPDQPPSFLETWERGGWVGVDLFFVLSGFLVSTLLFREFATTGTVDAKRFLIRRGFKIYPAFWILFASTLISRLMSHQPMSRRTILGEALFLQNYLGGLWPHTWSLAVEEHFYLGLVVLFVYLARSPYRFDAIPVIAASIAATCLLLRIATHLFHPEFSYEWNLFGTHIRIDSLFFGVFLAYLNEKKPFAIRFQSVPTVLLVLAGVLLLSPAFLFQLERTPWISIYGLILFYLGSGALLVAALRLKSSNTRVLNVLGLLGAASYSIYLWHIPVNVFVWKASERLPENLQYVGYFVSYFVGSVAVGWVLNRLIENPLLILRDRMFPSLQSSRPVTVAPVATLP